MTVTVQADVGGHVITLDVNGARLLLDRHTAMRVASYLSQTLDALYSDDSAAITREKLAEHYLSDLVCSTAVRPTQEAH